MMAYTIMEGVIQNMLLGKGSLLELTAWNATLLGTALQPQSIPGHKAIYQQNDSINFTTQRWEIQVCLWLYKRLVVLCVWLVKDS